LLDQLEDVTGRRIGSLPDQLEDVTGRRIGSLPDQLEQTGKQAGRRTVCSSRVPVPVMSYCMYLLSRDGNIGRIYPSQILLCLST